MNRRTFFKITVRTTTVAGVVATGVGRAAASPPLPIVDTHQHLWDLNVLNLPWISSTQELNRSFLPADYQQATAGLHVVKAVYMEVAAPPHQQLLEAEHIVALCKRSSTPTCAAVIGGQPDADGFREYIARFAGSPFVKGVRHGFTSVTDALTRGIRLLGDFGMCFDICVPVDQLGEGVRLAERCPDTRFVVDHCGNADPKAFATESRCSVTQSRLLAPPHGGPGREEERGLQDLRHCRPAPKGTWTADDLAPIVDHCLDVFGPDRVMFGSDWPVCTRVARYRQWVGALKEIVGNHSTEAQRKLFHDNAVRFYELQ